MSYKIHGVQWVKIKSLFRRSPIGNLNELSLSVLNKVTLSVAVEKIPERIVTLHVTIHFV